jgi:hypothetical protein
MRILCCLCLLIAVSACNNGKTEILKSPCVGLEGSPCGPKRPLNDWHRGDNADLA